MAEFLGTKIGGRYEIRERVGAGGMARVFKAWDSNLDRLVAVKILHEHFVDDPAFAERFTREAKLVASLNHPHIVQVFDYNSFDRDDVSVFYMVMPFLEGRTLHDLLADYEERKTPFPRERALPIIDELCQALGYAHERGMAHRDVKPGNVIILEEDGRTILTDFGIARMVESPRLTRESLTTGTPAYMSPEQVNGGAGDARSDLYSLGVMLFEMMTGRLPFTDDGGLSQILKHLSAPVPLVETVTGTPEPRLDAILQRALAKDPADRYQSAADFAKAVKSLAYLSANDSTVVIEPSGATDRSKAATATTTLEPQPTPASKQPASPWLRWIIPVVALLVVLVAAALLAQPKHETESMTGEDEENPSPTLDPRVDLNRLPFTSTFELDDSTLDHWLENPQGGLEAVFDLEAGLYELTNTQPGTAHTALVQTDKPYGDVTITMNARLEDDSANASGYGIVFRYHDEDNYNVFAADGIGRYSIWVRENGEWRELRGTEERWTPDEHVLRIGNDNRLRLNIFGPLLTGSINDEQVVRLNDETFASGGLGIYVATPADGTATVSVDEYEVYPLVPSMLD